MNVTRQEETEDEIGLLVDLESLMNALETRCRQNAHQYQQRNNLENVLAAQTIIGKLKRACQKRWKRQAGG